MTPRAPTVMLLTESDAAVLERVADGVFDHAVRPELALEFLRDPRSLIAVALDNGFVIGMATAFSYIHPDKPLQLFINEMGVSPAHRGQGVAKRLVALLLERGRQLGCKNAWGATDETNTPARSVFSATGGKEEPARAAVYIYGLPAVGE